MAAAETYSSLWRETLSGQMYTHLEAHTLIHSHSAPHNSTTQTQTHHDQQASLCLRIIEVFFSL